MLGVEDAQHRRERIAGNEASFREVNEAMPDFLQPGGGRGASALLRLRVR